MRDSSETPRFGYSTVTDSSTRAKVSRSPVRMRTSNPWASACVASVAMMSSASNPSTSTARTSSAPRTSFSRSTWPLNSDGLAERFALYSGNRSVRNVTRETSKATQTWVGRSSRRALMSIAVKP